MHKDGLIAMALFFLPEIGVVLIAAGQAALTAIGIGAVLSLSGDTSKEKRQITLKQKIIRRGFEVNWGLSMVAILIMQAW